MKNFSLWSLILLLGLSACNNYDFADDSFDDLSDPFVEEQGDFDDESGEDEETEGGLTLYEVIGSDLRKIKDYPVPNRLKRWQEDTERHQQMWDFYKKLIPSDQLHLIKEFEVFHSNDELAGYVFELDDGSRKWRTGLAIDLPGDLNGRDLNSEFAYTCIHEFGHILTLNESQMQSGSGSCSTYQTYEGCTSPHSYINELFNIGWTDIHEEHQSLDEDELYDFYLKYQNRFVTDYAATNPGEDIAEVFTTFVINDNAPTGNTIADQKINAMYNRDELIELRKHMRNAPDVLALRLGKRPKLKCNHQAHAHKNKRVEIRFQ